MDKIDVMPARSGILLLNKHEGITSNTALKKAKNLFGIKKAGHAGCLDPLATGMLPVCFNESTKICQYLLNSDKCYETTGLLGIKTNTADATGEIIAKTDDFSISKTQLTEILKHYRGSIEQVPSMFSALKHQGVPLYKLARKGIEIERKVRNIIIDTLDLTAFDGKQFSLTVVCSKGTYIRNLVEDIGDTLNVGAHVTRLHRLYCSGFQNKPMYTLEQLEQMTFEQRIQCLIPMDEAIDYLQAIILSQDEVFSIRQGKIIARNMNVTKTDCVRLYDEQSQFIGIGEIHTDGSLKAKRLMAF